MNSKIQHEIADDILSYLYSREVFQSLNEQRQLNLLQFYKQSKHFRDILNVAVSLQDVIAEVEQFIPPVTEEVEQYFSQTPKSILDKAVIEDNIIYIEAEHFQKKCGPFIVCLQQGDEMTEVEQFCKGMLVALFELCHRQRRDLYIISFAEELVTLPFVYDQLDRINFDAFVQQQMQGVTKLQPALMEAIHIIDEAIVQDQSELMIISNNHFVDFNEELLEALGEELAKRNVSVSAIAMSEETFNRQPLSFVEKVFFVNE